MKSGAIIEGQVESISFGGDGIMRHEGKVLFVPFVARGERITAKIIQDKKSFAKAHLVHILEASSDRVTPRCEYFGRCGGCQLQHLNNDAQAMVKHRFVVDALSRIGGLSAPNVLPIVKAQETWAYRRHVKLHVIRNGEGSISLTYVRYDGRGHVPVTHCPIFSDEMHGVIREVQFLIEQIEGPSHHKEGEVMLVKAGNFVVVLLDLPAVRNDLEPLLQKTIATHPLIKGALWRVRETVRQVGDVKLQFDLDGLTICYSPLSFVQAHPQQSALLYRALFARVTRIPVRRVVDLYCGIGATSLLLARDGLDVVGIEINPQAIVLANANARKNAIRSVQFVVGDADEIVAATITKHSPDVVIVNPPRTGLGGGVREALVSFKPSRIMYISCMPATLARDVKALCAAGYDVTFCEPFDMFPQTTHVETLVELSLRPNH